jgi:hypothetical protein
MSIVMSMMMMIIISIHPASFVTMTADAKVVIQGNDANLVLGNVTDSEKFQITRVGEKHVEVHENMKATRRLLTSSDRDVEATLAPLFEPVSIIADNLASSGGFTNVVLFDTTTSYDLQTVYTLSSFGGTVVRYTIQSEDEDSAVSALWQRGVNFSPTNGTLSLFRTPDQTINCCSTLFITAFGFDTFAQMEISIEIAA